MKYLIANYQKAFYPYEDVSVDEMVIKYKGRWKNKQYNPSKPSKYIKTFGLCDSATWYAFNILNFFGSDTSYNSDTYGMEQSEKFLNTYLILLERVIIFLLIDITQRTL